MIVIGSNIVLTPDEAALPPGTPWIGYDNLVTPTNITATTFADAAHPASNMANPLTHIEWWSGVNTGDELLTVTLPAATLIDYVGVARHNWGSGGNTVTIEGKLDPGGYATLVGPQILPNDTPVIFRFSPQTLTHVRIRIQAGSLAVRKAAVVYVGKLLVMERSFDIGTDHIPLPIGRKAKVITGMSESGNFLGRIVTQHTRESKGVFKHITPAWYRAKMDPFIAASKTTPFFWAWYPIEYPNESGFAWMTNEPQPAMNPVTQRIQIDLEMRGIA